MRVDRAVVSGLLGAAAMSVVAAGIRALGAPFHMELVLGTMTGIPPSSGSFALGLAIHLTIGALFGAAFGLLFEHVWAHGGAGTGMLQGVVHAAFFGVSLDSRPSSIRTSRASWPTRGRISRAQNGTGHARDHRVLRGACPVRSARRSQIRTRCGGARVGAARTCLMEKPTFLLFTLLLAALPCSGCGKASPAGPGERKPGQPVETPSSIAEGQKPAFTGQTRAPYRSANVAFDVRTIASGLEHPWSLAFLPDGAMLVTEKRGRMRIALPDGTLSPSVAGVPKVSDEGQGGLLDVALGPAFATDGVLYFAFSEPRQGGNGTAVMRARIVRQGTLRLEDLRVIWRMTPTMDSKLHFGCRLVFARDGHLFITTGERFISAGRKQAQKLDSAFGKIIRIAPDGSAPADNPFASREGALREIYSIGHRNVQAAALHPVTGALWIVDHGARGGDEINVVRPGRDYGWPTITYGVEYAGGKVGAGITAREGMEQPLYYWDPSIAPSGMAFYRGEMFPEWSGSLFVGALAGKHLARLTLEGERVIGEERLLAERNVRIRDVRVAANGALYVLTDESKGELLALIRRTP
jgi:aldose sugar dehydrogenase